MPFVPVVASIAFTLIVAAYTRRICARRASAATPTGSIVGRRMDVPHTNNVRSAHSMRVKFGLAGHPASSLSKHWSAEGAPGDWSLYDGDGFTRARVVQGGASYHLRAPAAIPHQSWASLDAAVFA